MIVRTILLPKIDQVSKVSPHYFIRTILGDMMVYNFILGYIIVLFYYKYFVKIHILINIPCYCVIL